MTPRVPWPRDLVHIATSTHALVIGWTPRIGVDNDCWRLP